jgi:hypothetical protein
MELETKIKALIDMLTTLLMEEARKTERVEKLKFFSMTLTG